MTDFAGWFAGPKGENGDGFERSIAKIIQDYYYWRRNYYPEDGLVIDAESRRTGEKFNDAFDDRLFELLALLKADFPFQSPRYAAHMVAEQTLPSIAGYFAAMLYNPNNVTSEAAPVTVRLELEASQMIAQMVGYDEHSWAHLASGGTVANIEAFWMARTVCYLPLVVADMRRILGLAADPIAFGCAPEEALASFAKVFEEAPTIDAIRAYRDSDHNVVERGWCHVLASLGTQPVVIAPETQHYSIKKALDVLGLGRKALRTVRVDSELRMDLDHLEETLDKAERSGEHVLALVAIVGSTEEGAIDPVDKILRMRDSRQHKFWVHADGAYGGYLRTVTLPDRLGLGEPKTQVKLCGRVQDLALDLPVGASCDALEALGGCDSVTIDPHKLGYVPYPAGAICFKSNLVKPLARQDAPYIEDSVGDVQAERGSKAIGVYILEGSKPGATAAAVWLSHKLIPLDKTGHGKLMQEAIRNACELHATLEVYPQVCEDDTVQAVSVCRPGSNILCFAFVPNEPITLDNLNRLNHRIYDRFNVSEQEGRRVYNQPFFLSRTSLSAGQYSPESVADFLTRLGVSAEDYQRYGVFLLRSVLMNPWYTEAKRHGRYFISELVEEMFRAAREELKLVIGHQR